jgi:hypothetical protein
MSPATQSNANGASDTGGFVVLPIGPPRSARPGDCRDGLAHCDVGVPVRAVGGLQLARVPPITAAS